MNTSLKEYGVSTIIAIDDIFNEINEKNFLSEFAPEIIEDLTNNGYERYREYSISQYIEETGKPNFIEELRDRINENDRYTWLRSDDIEFREIGANVELVKRALGEINLEDSSRKNLIILDRMLQHGSGDSENNRIFIEILRAIQESIREKNLLLLIYTESPPEELDSFEGAKNYLIELGLDENASEQIALHFNYVQKSEELSNSFFENILKSQKANYIQEYNKIFKESYKKLTERLWQLNKNQTLFYYDYLNEGKHADEILYDIFLAKFNQVYLSTFENDENYSKLINPIRRSMQQHLSQINRPQLDIYRELKDFEKDLHNQNNLLPVSRSSDIAFGDVIKMGQSHFMLMSQDCDVVLRNTGTRKLANIQLVEVELSEAEVSNRSLWKRFKDHLSDTTLAAGLEELGISQTNIEDSKENKNNASTEQIGRMKVNEGYKPRTKNIVFIEAWWIDCLVLRRNDDNEIEFTEDNIERSHEIRLGTSGFLRAKLSEILEKLSSKEEDVVRQIIEYSLSNLAIEVNFIYQENVLKGFKIGNYSRIGRLDRLTAMRILKDVLNDESRIPDTYTSVI